MEPWQQLEVWLADAKSAGISEHDAMALATSDVAGAPSCRMVLLRGLDARGLVFFTNRLSRKGRQLSENPRAAATLWWGPLHRQVRVEGRVELVSDAESDAYFASRAAESQRSAMASPQSEVIESREWLMARVEAIAGDPSRLPHWGGYRLLPERFEFWTGMPARLHDRVEFLLVDGTWQKRLLAP